MPRLFIAIDLPDPAIAALSEIELPEPTRARKADVKTMHLTLHFLGDAQIECAVEALQNVVATSFPLTIQSVGQFTSRDSSVILWVGVKVSRELRTLHEAIGQTISGHGFKVEDRPYTPHITLARYKAGLPKASVKAFLSRYESFATPEFPVTTFCLYSSTLLREGPVYHCERSFPLATP